MEWTDGNYGTASVDADTITFNIANNVEWYRLDQELTSFDGWWIRQGGSYTAFCETTEDWIRCDAAGGSWYGAGRIEDGVKFYWTEGGHDNEALLVGDTLYFANGVEWYRMEQ